MTDKTTPEIAIWLDEVAEMSKDQMERFFAAFAEVGPAGMWVEWTPEGMGYLPVNTLWPDPFPSQSQNSDSAGVRITSPDPL